jgi:threonine dehydratase
VDLHGAVIEAGQRIREHVRRTPVERSPALSTPDLRVWLKLENHQRTGSFKLRGAMNKLLSMEPSERARGVVAASSGNHGAAVACGAASVPCPATIFVPTCAEENKIAAIEARGAEVRREGTDCVDAEAAAREHARAKGCVYISPYNDGDVVAGQGTVGLELSEQLAAIDAVFVALGGGGLISGIGGYLKSLGRPVRVVACSPENSPVMHVSLEKGEIVQMESLPTLSDGTAGGVEPGALTFDLCREIVDDTVLVGESEIADAMRLIVGTHHTLVEGAAAVAVAGFLKYRHRLEGGNVVVVLCGANVAPATLVRVLG